MTKLARLIRAVEIAENVYSDSESVAIMAEFIASILQQKAKVFMWQHDETGRTGFVDKWQLDNGWQDQNPRLRVVEQLYTLP